MGAHMVAEHPPQAARGRHRQAAALGAGAGTTSASIRSIEPEPRRGQAFEEGTQVLLFHPAQGEVLLEGRPNRPVPVGKREVGDGPQLARRGVAERQGHGGEEEPGLPLGHDVGPAPGREGGLAPGRRQDHREDTRAAERGGADEGRDRRRRGHRRAVPGRLDLDRGVLGDSKGRRGAPASATFASSRSTSALKTSQPMERTRNFNRFRSRFLPVAQPMEHRDDRLGQRRARSSPAGMKAKTRCRDGEGSGPPADGQPEAAARPTVRAERRA